MESLRKIFGEHAFEFQNAKVSIIDLLIFILIIIAGRLFFLFFQRIILRGFFKRRDLDVGRQYSLTYLIKYFYYLLLVITAFQLAGINLSVFLAAGAALLVGVGIGLQQMFSDLISGIILLFEGSIEKDDWVEIGATEGIVRKIGLRTSLIETRRGVSIIVPNSKLTADNVVNLSHNNDFIRYSIKVGTSYDISAEKVHKVLHQVASDAPKVLHDPTPIVRLTDFADSAVMFELLFWSKEYKNIEDVKSEIRFAICKAFEKNDIIIPYPQRDVHVKVEKENSYRDLTDSRKLFE